MGYGLSDVARDSIRATVSLRMPEVGVAPELYGLAHQPRARLGQVGQDIVLALIHERGELGQPGTELVGDMAEGLACSSGVERWSPRATAILPRPMPGRLAARIASLSRSRGLPARYTRRETGR
jgi:hypothetical protein